MGKTFSVLSRIDLSAKKDVLDHEAVLQYLDLLRGLEQGFLCRPMSLNLLLHLIFGQPCVGPALPLPLFGAAVELLSRR